MSIAETLDAAMNRLEKLRDTCTPGRWLIDDNNKVEIYYEDGGATILRPDDYYPRGDNSPAENAELVITLHRTIAAQIAIISHAIDEYAPWDDAQSFIVEDGLALAKAILGSEE